MESVRRPVRLKRHLVPDVGGVRLESQGRGSVTGATVFGNAVLLGAIPVEDMDMIVHSSLLTAIPKPQSPKLAVSLGVGCRTIVPNGEAR
ncbi:MAG: hypothetical protein RQ833_03835 [Sphingomonadaceae bacterium]|nr:hypothetical protein [Sphingomonadaceae bacterium]